MTKKARKAIARIMAVLMVFTLLPFQFSANMAMVEASETSESTGGGHKDDEAFSETDVEEAASAEDASADTENVTVTQSESAEDTLTEDKTDMEQDEEGSVWVRDDDVTHEAEEAEEDKTEKGYIEDNNLTDNTFSFTADDISSELNISAGTPFPKGTQEYGKFTFLNKNGTPKITAANVTYEGTTYINRFEFGSASSFVENKESRLIRFETGGRAIVTVCAYTGVEGRAIKIDRKEDGSADQEHVLQKML